MTGEGAVFAADSVLVDADAVLLSAFMVASQAAQSEELVARSVRERAAEVFESADASVLELRVASSRRVAKAEELCALADRVRAGVESVVDLGPASPVGEFGDEGVDPSAFDQRSLLLADRLAQLVETFSARAAAVEEWVSATGWSAWWASRSDALAGQCAVAAELEAPVDRLDASLVRSRRVLSACSAAVPVGLWAASAFSAGGVKAPSVLLSWLLIATLSALAVVFVSNMVSRAARVGVVPLRPNPVSAVVCPAAAVGCWALFVVSLGFGSFELERSTGPVFAVLAASFASLCALVALMRAPVPRSS